MAVSNRKEFGQYIVADPEICGGELTFRGTRIFVKDVLEMVAEGMPWEEITKTWYGRVSHEAIAEAVALANAALSEKAANMRQAA
jgi:uncharacterized protein (DUF433 family)